MIYLNYIILINNKKTLKKSSQRWQRAEPSRARAARITSRARGLMLGSARVRTSHEFDARLGARSSRLCSRLLGSDRDARRLWLGSIQNVFTSCGKRFLHATC